MEELIMSFTYITFVLFYMKPTATVRFCFFYWKFQFSCFQIAFNKSRGSNKGRLVCSFNAVILFVRNETKVQHGI